MRDLRNHGGEVIDRVEHGEAVTITRAGKQVARLVALPRVRPTTEELISRRRHLPPVDPEGLRRDVDAIVDQAL